MLCWWLLALSPPCFECTKEWYVYFDQKLDQNINVLLMSFNDKLFIYQYAGWIVSCPDYLF
jgi:hypothetical protein